MSNLSKADWSDPEKVKALAESYEQRYGRKFWSAFYALLGYKLFPHVVDLGCGPGLFLSDAVKRLGATQVCGLDSSEEMLGYARNILGGQLPPNRIGIRRVNFDTDSLDLAGGTADLVFCGYLLHELQDPKSFIRSAADALKTGGILLAFDFVSGDPDGFVSAMVERGMSEDEARRRYPHMCKHSLDDLVALFNEAQLRDVSSQMVDSYRAMVKGVR
ncbi:MAG: class I SAM-dependent methyltransferase [Candidatus Thorarchaeota archaeon]